VPETRLDTARIRAARRVIDPVFLASFDATTDSTNTIADAVAGRRPIPAVLDDILLVADDAVLVREASIIAGMRMLLDHAGLVVEPSAALGIAAIKRRRGHLSQLGRCGSYPQSPA
jgi:threonine dehydratase